MNKTVVVIGICIMEVKARLAVTTINLLICSQLVIWVKMGVVMHRIVKATMDLFMIKIIVVAKINRNMRQVVR